MYYNITPLFQDYLMKISIITVTLNSAKTLRDTLNSVHSQNYNNIEHIIVDGGSEDETLKILKQYSFKNKKIFIKKNYGIYKSINYGIKQAKGEIIHILNSDDIYNSNSIIKEMMLNIHKQKKIDLFLGNLLFFRENQINVAIRWIESKKFEKEDLKLGLMPAHPALFVRNRLYKKYGAYNERLKIASDFDFFLRMILIKNLRFKTYNKSIIRMRIGGISTKNIWSYFINTKEILYSFKVNRISINFLILLRFIFKMPQFILPKKDEFKIFNLKDFDKYYENKTIKLARKLSSILSKKSFILSALNLAFIGYFIKGKIKLHKKLFNWHDGIMAKFFSSSKKIPGYSLLQKKYFKHLKNVKNIVILGPTSKNQIKYLHKITNYTKHIKFIKLPFGKFSVIKKAKMKIYKNTLILITLPTPKQEQLAEYLINKGNNLKIICIGGGLSIAAGDTKKVPKFLSNYEYLWRLQYEPVRRTIRILETIYYYLKGKYFQKTLSKLYFREID